MLSARQLDIIVSDLIGIIPSQQLAEVIDRPELEENIRKSRATSISVKILEEVVAATSTHGLFNLNEKPGHFAATLASGRVLSMVDYSYVEAFRRQFASILQEKIYDMMPFASTIETQLEAKGLSRTYFGILGDSLEQTEYLQEGLTKLRLLVKPLLQGLAVRSKIPKYLLVPSIILSYALIPVFSQLGEKDIRLNDLEHTVNDAISRGKYYGEKTLSPELEKIQEKSRKKRDRNIFFKELIGDLSSWAMLLSRKYLPIGKAMGIFSYFQNLLSIPSGYRELKKREVRNKLALGSAKAYIDIINGNPLMLTDSAWDRYRISKLRLNRYSEKFLEPGIYIRNLKTKIPDTTEERYTPELNFDLKPGTIVQLHAESGTGKSVSTGLGLAGVVETLGTVYFTDSDGKTRPMEMFDRKELKKRVLYVSQSTGFNHMRVCDIYQRRALDSYLQSTGKCKEMLDDQEILMITMTDSKLEQQLWALSKDIQEKKGLETDLHEYGDLEKCNVSLEGIVPIFEHQYFESLYQFRKSKLELIDKYLRAKGGNFENIKASQSYGSLSTGMRIRFTNEYYNELYRNNGDSNKMRVIILDEPSSALDPENARRYYEGIREEIDAGREGGPNSNTAYLLISHTHHDVIKEVFDGVLSHAEFKKQ